jgi:methionyl-tRNA formyltransferase
MGTPDFAVPALDALRDCGADVVCVVTQPDRRRGRGHRTAPGPVKVRAEELGIPVVQPASLREGREWPDALAEVRPDLIVVCAYGKILPKDTLDAPRLGCVNIHASLLPAYRGAAPVHRAVEAGDRESGVTLMYMSEGLDEGDIIASRRVSIEGMNTGEVSDALAALGAELLSDELPAIVNGEARREPQNEEGASYAPPVSRDEGHVDFTRTPEEVVRKVLAMTPSPGAYALMDGDKLKIWEARVPDVSGCAGCPGEVTAKGGVMMVTAGRGGVVEITRIQSPGGKPMSAADWLRGHDVKPGATFL